MQGSAVPSAGSALITDISFIAGSTSGSQSAHSRIYDA
jgi:hypothetical protein